MAATARLVGAGTATLAVLATLAAALPARAAGQLDFSVVPVGAEHYFVYDTRAGRTVTGELGLVSRADRTQTIRLRAVDVGTAATGGLDYGLVAPSRVGEWLALARRSVVLGPREVVRVSFEAHVPEGARPGDHLAGLVAYEASRRSQRAGAGGVRLRFRSRLAVAVQLRLPGRRRPQLAFTGAEIVQSPAGVRIELRLRNVGNTLVERTAGNVTISQDGRQLVDAPVRIDSFAPDSEISYPLAVPGRPVQGAYSVSGTLRPEGAPPVRIDAEVDLTPVQAQSFEEATGREVVRPAGSSLLRLVVLLLPVPVALVFAIAYAMARRQETRLLRALREEEAT